MRGRLLAPGLAAAVAAAAACASGSGGPVASTHPGSRAPLPAEGTVAPARDEPGVGVARAVASGERDVAYARVLETLERCGTRPLGQQALLLLAASELDPRNPDPRLPLALRSAQLVLQASEPEAWARVLAESLYLLALRIGAREPGAYAADEAELGVRVRKGNERAAFPVDEECEALPWPAGPTAEVGDPPALQGPSYPARIDRLRRRVAELESELERLRRISKEP